MAIGDCRHQVPLTNLIPLPQVYNQGLFASLLPEGWGFLNATLQDFGESPSNRRNKKKDFPLVVAVPGRNQNLPPRFCNQHHHPPPSHTPPAPSSHSSSCHKDEIPDSPELVESMGRASSPGFKGRPKSTFGKRHFINSAGHLIKGKWPPLDRLWLGRGRGIDYHGNQGGFHDNDAQWKQGPFFVNYNHPQGYFHFGRGESEEVEGQMMLGESALNNKSVDMEHYDNGVADKVHHKQNGYPEEMVRSGAASDTYPDSDHAVPNMQERREVPGDSGASSQVPSALPPGVYAAQGPGGSGAILPVANTTCIFPPSGSTGACPAGPGSSPTARGGAAVPQSYMALPYFPYLIIPYTENLLGPVNYAAPPSCDPTGMDLPQRDPSTMRFFFNLGIEYYRLSTYMHHQQQQQQRFAPNTYLNAAAAGPMAYPIQHGVANGNRGGGSGGGSGFVPMATGGDPGLSSLPAALEDDLSGQCASKQSVVKADGDEVVEAESGCSPPASTQGAESQETATKADSSGSSADNGKQDKAERNIKEDSNPQPVIESRDARRSKDDEEEEEEEEEDDLEEGQEVYPLLPGGGPGSECHQCQYEKHSSSQDSGCLSDVSSGHSEPTTSDEAAERFSRSLRLLSTENSDAHSDSSSQHSGVSNTNSLDGHMAAMPFEKFFVPTKSQQQRCNSNNKAGGGGKPVKLVRPIKDIPPRFKRLLEAANAQKTAAIRSRQLEGLPLVRQLGPNGKSKQHVVHSPTGPHPLDALSPMDNNASHFNPNAQSFVPGQPYEGSAGGVPPEEAPPSSQQQHQQQQPPQPSQQAVPAELGSSGGVDPGNCQVVDVQPALLEPPPPVYNEHSVIFAPPGPTYTIHIVNGMPSTCTYTDSTGPMYMNGGGGDSGGGSSFSACSNASGSSNPYSLGCSAPTVTGGYSGQPPSASSGASPVTGGYYGNQQPCSPPVQTYIHYVPSTMPPPPPSQPQPLLCHNGINGTGGSNGHQVPLPYTTPQYSA